MKTITACLIIAFLLTIAVPVQAAQCTFYTKRSTVYLLVIGNAKLMRNGHFIQYVSTGKYMIGPVRAGVTWRCA